MSSSPLAVSPAVAAGPKPRTVGIIPARFASTRFPGKPLHLIAGKPMIQRTYEQASKAKNLDDLYVATDDERIRECVEAFGGRCIMTGDCATGSDRCWQAVSKLDEHFDIVLNIQGDEPCVEPAHIDAITSTLYAAPADVNICAVAAPIRTEAEARNRAVTKVVMDKDNFALYFSRAMIPHSKGGEWSRHVLYYKNCGMYCYRRDFLGVFASRPKGPLQLEEDLEQLKVLEMGQRLKMCIVADAVGGIDTPEQAAALEEQLTAHGKPDMSAGTSSSKQQKAAPEAAGARGGEQ